MEMELAFSWLGFQHECVKGSGEMRCCDVQGVTAGPRVWRDSPVSQDGLVPALQ